MTQSSLRRWLSTPGPNLTNTLRPYTLVTPIIRRYKVSRGGYCTEQISMLQIRSKHPYRHNPSQRFSITPPRMVKIASRQRISSIKSRCRRVVTTSMNRSTRGELVCLIQNRYLSSTIWRYLKAFQAQKRAVQTLSNLDCKPSTNQSI